MEEKTAPGTGYNKLKLLVTGKAKSPRCFNNFNNPTIYTYANNAWITVDIFKYLFFKHFVPEV